MGYLKLSFINLIKFIKEHTVMFIIFVLVEIISITAILCSYGLIANSTTDNKNRTIDYQYIKIPLTEYGESIEVQYSEHISTSIREIKETKNITAKKFKEEILPYLEENQYLKDNIELISLACTPKNLTYAENTESLYNFESNYYTEQGLELYDDEEFYRANEFEKSEYNAGKKVVYIPKIYEYEEPTIVLGNTTYEVITTDSHYGINLSYDVLDDDILIRGFSIYLLNKIQYSELEELQKQLSAYFDIDMEEAEIPSEPEPIVIQINNTIILCCILIILVILINVSLLYKYIIATRTANLSISKLCGCTTAKAYIIYMVEIMTIILTCYIISFVLFKFCIVPIIAKSFLFFETPYPMQLHFILFVAYIVVAFLLMTSHVYKILKQPMIFLKKGGS